MVHRTDFTSPYVRQWRAERTERRRLLRVGALLIGFGGLVLLLCVAVVLGLRDIALALW